MKQTNPITVKELKKFLEDKHEDMVVYVSDGIRAVPLCHTLYWEQELADVRILLSKSIYDR